jgi:hypothetical protein
LGGCNSHDTNIPNTFRPMITPSKSSMLLPNLAPFGLALIHMFRMQAFFLIAGFFAHLVYSRRGGRAFLGQRLLRIGVPLVVGWLILFPMCRRCYVWGAFESDAAMSGLTMSQAFWESFTDWSLFKSRFSLAHLWFLNLLLLLYGATSASILLGNTLRFPATWRAGLRAGFTRLIESRWNVVLLALATAVFLYRLGWSGVDTPRTLLPPFGSFMIYWLFFLVGWCLHANVDLLKQFDKYWKLHLAGGLALSIPIFLFISSHAQRGKLTYHKVYPALVGPEIQDWPGLREDLLDHEADHTDHPGANVWRALPMSVREFIRETPQLGYKLVRSLRPIYSSAPELAQRSIQRSLDCDKHMLMRERATSTKSCNPTCQEMMPMVMENLPRTWDGMRALSEWWCIACANVFASCWNRRLHKRLMHVVRLMKKSLTC